VCRRRRRSSPHPGDGKREQRRRHEALLHHEVAIHRDGGVGALLGLEDCALYDDHVKVMFTLVP
jgi:hypothetical protein